MNAEQLIRLVSANSLLYDLTHHTISTVTLKLKEKIWDKIFTVVFNNKVLNNAYNISFIINNLAFVFQKQTLKTMYF
jgi:hypothetical protein